MRRLIFASLLLLFASAVQAATTNISGGGTGVLSAAITAATAGDTINITDSATYSEALLYIDKVVYITADSGQSPVITNSGALTTNTLITFAAGSGGTTTANCAKLGSLSGGQIHVQFQTQATVAQAGAIFRFKQGNTNYAILENLKITETGTNPPINVIMHDNKACEFIKLSYLDVDMHATEYLGTTNPATFIMAGSGDKRNYVAASNETYFMDHVRVRNFGAMGICLTNPRTVFRMTYCDFGTLGATSNLALYPLSCFQVKNNATNFTGVIDHSVFRAPATGNAIQPGGGASSGGASAISGAAAYTSLTLSRCVFISKYPGSPWNNEVGPAASGGYGPVMLMTSASSWYAGDTHQRIHFDHCDLIDLTEGTYANVGAFVRPSNAPVANAGTKLTLTNNNFYSKNNAAFVKANLAYPITYAEANNNFFGATASTDGYTTGTADLSLDPGYLYPEAGDVRYTNTTLKTADELGGPIGCDAGYMDVASGTIETKIGVRYAANPPAGGTIDSVTSTTYNINSGDSCPAKTAAVNAHYTWGGWSDGNMNLARPADTGITASKLYTANFIIDTYTVNYAAGANGEVTGTLTQVIGWNENGTSVLAVPATGYHFTQWEDALTSNPRTDYNVTANATHTASFGINSYNYSYVAGIGGTVNGDEIVTGTTDYNTNGPSVTAAPSTGYVFAKWLDNNSTNPTRQDVITADFVTTATFNALTYYTLTYTAGAGGTITGELSQSVGQGFSGTEVVAVPNTGYHFTGWSDGVLTAARTETNVTADVTVTANFAINTYTLTYTAGTNGSITGTTPQTVDYGANGTEVVAVPDSGYRFVSWSDGVLTAARTDLNVTGNISVTATFASNSCTLTYTAGTGGTITGTTPQIVTYGSNGTEVVAVPNTGYTFVRWSDGVLTAARTDTNVAGDINVTAIFALPAIKVPTDYGTIQAAINAATEGGTVEIVNSATYKENLRINKSVSLVATAGQTPKIEQLDNTTTNPVILGYTATPSNIQLGSLSGGRITFQYMKWGVGTLATLPYGMIRIDATTGSTVLIENCDIISTGTTTYGPCTGIQHPGNPCSVTIRYTNINLNRGDYAAGGVSANRNGCTGIDLSNNSPTGTAGIIRRSLPGPAYTLDHVRIKGYVRAGIWLLYTSTTLNASYVDIGTYGENMLIESNNIPWGPLIAYGSASWNGRIDHSLFQGPLCYPGFGRVGPRGTSITLSRNVILGGGGTSATWSALDASSQDAGAGNPVQLTIDHCDIVHLGNSPAAALARTAATGQINLSITNSNIYSKTAQAINMTQIATPNVFSSSYNNVYGAAAAVGYTAGNGDVSMDPGYTDPAIGDVRYSNPILRRSDSAHGPIGVNSDYSDVFNIVEGDNTSVNRAHGWTLMK